MKKGYAPARLLGLSPDHWTTKQFLLKWNLKVDKNEILDVNLNVFCKLDAQFYIYNSVTYLFQISQYFSMQFWSN